MLTRLSLLVLLWLSPALARADITVFAAASLKEPLDALAQSYPGVVVSYAGSGTLARQVTLGAPADVVLLANVAWMEVLIDGDHVQPDTVIEFARNRLVVIGGAGAAEVTLDLSGINAALGDGRLAIGLTQAVPAGIYAKEALTTLGLWDDLSARLAEVDSVRGALNLVARGQAPLGIVYATDARVTDAARVLATFPTDSHSPIRYLGAVTAEAQTDAAGFLSFLTGPDGRDMFAAAGFLPPNVSTR